MKRSAGTLLAILFALSSCTLDLQRTEYATIAAARADNLFGRGWAPDVVPDDEGPLVEVHDIDTNKRCSRLRLRVAAVPVVEAALHAAGFRSCHPETPPGPMGAYPFGNAEIRVSSSCLCRAAPHGGEPEHAVLDKAGTLYFWANGS